MPPAVRQQYHFLTWCKKSNRPPVETASVAPLPSLTVGARRPLLGQGEVKISATPSRGGADLPNLRCRGYPCRRKYETHRGFHLQLSSTLPFPSSPRRRR